ncbi:MAG: sulfatase family protein [Thermomicrobiales bacterium]
MSSSRLASWTRRRLALATGAALASLQELLDWEEAAAKNKDRRKRKRRRKRRQKRRRRNQNQNPNPNPPPTGPPDILVIYVDDMREDDFLALSRTRALLAGEGATYPNYFMTTPLCGPSRASFFRGQYAHNTGVRSNQDGYAVFNGIDSSTIATWLRDADPSYRTAHVGKHINGYRAAQGQIGPGWTDWIVPVPVAFYDYTLNVNGTSEAHGDRPQHYLTDVMARKARNIVATTPAETPLFMYFAPKAPHGPSTPADRHEGSFADAELDKDKPSFNEADMSDKPDYMQRDPLSQADINALERSNQLRLESLLAVDEAIESLVATLGQAGRLEQTYIFFVTDNGYLLGEHRRTAKNVPYEEVIRMSMLLRGPGVRRGVNNAMVTNIDLAPTIAALAGVAPPGFVDGRSLVPTFGGAGNSRQAILLEMFPPGPQADPEEEAIPAEARLLAVQAEPASTRRAIRTDDWVYVEHGTGERELYNLRDDPFQLESLHADPGQSERMQDFSAWLATLRNCSAASCRTAENGPPDS